MSMYILSANLICNLFTDEVHIIYIPASSPALWCPTALRDESAIHAWSKITSRARVLHRRGTGGRYIAWPWNFKRRRRGCLHIMEVRIFSLRNDRKTEMRLQYRYII